MDTPSPYRLGDFLTHLKDKMGQLDKPESSAPFLDVMARIEALKSDKRYAFMFAGLSVRDTLPKILSRLLRIPVEGRPITIMDLSGVPSEIVDVVVSVLSRGD